MGVIVQVLQLFDSMIAVTNFVRVRVGCGEKSSQIYGSRDRNAVVRLFIEENCCFEGPTR